MTRHPARTAAGTGRLACEAYVPCCQSYAKRGNLAKNGKRAKRLVAARQDAMSFARNITTFTNAHVNPSEKSAEI